MHVSLVTNTTKPPLEDTLFSAPQIVTSATPASVPPPRYDNAPTEFSVDEDAGSFISCNTSSVMDENTDNNPVDDDDVGNLMPVDWSFPGFITFALLGPIVPSGLVPYRSELPVDGVTSIRKRYQ